jgi:cytochrome oxidase Cu insertion factor (SCO1/SenC/PrrC family)
VAAWALLAFLLAGCQRAAPPAAPSLEPPAQAEDTPPDCCQERAPAQEAAGAVEQLSLPDVPLRDQDGREVRLADLLGQRVVAVQFMFTTCTTSCPLLGGRFAQLQKALGGRMGNGYGLLSVSVDPANDTPESLKAWAARYQAGPGWSLVTGRKPDVDRLLKAFGTFTPSKTDHPSTVVVVHGATRRCRRISGLATPAQIVRLMQEVGSPGPGKPLSRAEETGRRYFTDTVVRDQHDTAHRFYSDLLRGKVVVINTFFADCQGSCLKMSSTFAALQERLGDRLGKQVHLLSVSVNPEVDTPARLRPYARRWGARPGWYFITGDKENVAAILRKLGQYVEDKESHTSVLLVGNEPTGLWKKAFGLARPDAVYEVLDSVLADARR